LLFPINSDEKFDEVLSFLGASYFRALGQGQRYEKSAHALAIDTGLEKAEELPAFPEFWIGKPEFDAVSTAILGLVDSHSVGGVYHFELLPGMDTVIDIRSVLFFRNTVKWLGLDPVPAFIGMGETPIPILKISGLRFTVRMSL
tara:strand:- start:1712 stop:2143 length:432 start_codon:yes stop_codon:yes gene_type:complete